MSLQYEVDSYLSRQGFLLSAGSGSLRTRPDFCPICRGPKKPDFELCYQCNQHALVARQNNWKLADRTAFICYGNAKGGDQLGSDMFAYKEKYGVDDEAKWRIWSLLFHTLSYYWFRANTPPISVVTTVPSLKTAGPSQLEELVRIVANHLPHPPPVQSLLYPVSLRGAGPRERILNPKLFNTGTVNGHVLIIEDSWVTGSNAQSAAAALHQAGAKYVTILCIARLLYTDDMIAFNLKEEHRFIVGGSSDQSPFN